MFAFPPAAFLLASRHALRQADCASFCRSARYQRSASCTTAVFKALTIIPLARLHSVGGFLQFAVFPKYGTGHAQRPFRASLLGDGVMIVESAARAFGHCYPVPDWRTTNITPIGTRHAFCAKVFLFSTRLRRKDKEPSVSDDSRFLCLIYPSILYGRINLIKERAVGQRVSVPSSHITSTPLTPPNALALSIAFHCSVVPAYVIVVSEVQP